MDRRHAESYSGDEAVEPRKVEVEEQKVILLGNKTEERRDWSEILEDILELITARLHIGDRIQSSRVSKRWRRSIVVGAARKSHPTSYGNPCLLIMLKGGKTCRLIDHIRNEDYVINTPSIPRNMLIAHSNCGWLLLIECKMTDGAIFFFNPLTQATIELPKLQSPACLTYSTFSFSCEPTSSDCIVIGVLSCYEPNYTSFYYWVPGDKDWKIFTINHQDTNFRASHHKPFLLKDQIYHFDNNRRLGIYNLLDQKLAIIGEPPIRVEIFDTDYYNFVKMDDNLIFVYKEDNTDCKRIHLYVLDDSRMQWIKLDSTGGRSLFCSAINCIFTKAPTGVEGNKVYAWDHLENEIMMTYACVTNELQTVRKFADDTKDDLDFHWNNVCWIDLRS